LTAAHASTTAPVPPGVQVNRVTYQPGTTGGSISTAQRCPSGSRCRNADAEVITEIPSSASGTAPLADFGQVSYRAIQVTSRGGLHGAMTSNGLWTTHAIDMLDSAGHDLARPGPARAGQAFRITWYAAS
jgi:Peptidase A4 family